ncbi:MAG: ribonuclease P protein component [Prevotella sp.]|nr:ribonuclease P protein component [Prevotella sp.]
MFTLGKKERIKHLSAIRALFDGGKSIVAFPVRAIYHIRKHEENQPVASVLVSVPKRHFKHAVDRNRVKRQLREAFRLNKQMLSLPEKTHADIAFVWLDDKHYDTRQVEKRVRKLLVRINESSVQEETKAMLSEEET